MKILVINAGSSSLKFQLIDMDDESVIAKGICEEIGGKSGFKYKVPGREDYKVAVSLPTHAEALQLVLDTLVDEARKIDGVLGSRMTGAGFGGCTVSIVEADAVDEFIEKVGKNYTEKTGLVPEFYVSEIGNGGMEIKEF